MVFCLVPVISPEEPILLRNVLTLTKKLQRNLYNNGIFVTLSEEFRNFHLIRGNVIEAS